jgi:hypothetical protein
MWDQEFLPACNELQFMLVDDFSNEPHVRGHFTGSFGNCVGQFIRNYKRRLCHRDAPKIGGRISAWISVYEVLQDFTAPVWTSLRDCFYPTKFRLVSILSLAAFRSAHGEHDQELDVLPMPCHSNAG